MWKVRSRARHETCFCGLDIGSSKITVVLGTRKTGEFSIVGAALRPSEGMRNGVVVDIRKASESIAKVVSTVEEATGVKSGSVCVGISGSHVASENVGGVVSTGFLEVNQADFDRVVEVALAGIEQERKIIHVLPVEFDLDDTSSCLQNPIGMLGRKLSGDFHVITGQKTHVDHVLRACQLANMDVASLATPAIASSEAVLLEEEKQQGVLLVDIGAGVTDMAFFHQGSVFFSKAMEGGTGHIVNKLVSTLMVSASEVERLLSLVGTYHSARVEIERIGRLEKENLDWKLFVRLVRQQVIDFLRQVNAVINASMGRSLMSMGVVLTGGGALFPELAQLAEMVLKLPVRIGKPVAVTGLVEELNGPEWTAAIGLSKLWTG